MRHRSANEVDALVGRSLGLLAKKILHVLVMAFAEELQHAVNHPTLNRIALQILKLALTRQLVCEGGRSCHLIRGQRPSAIVVGFYELSLRLDPASHFKHTSESFLPL